MKFSLKNSGIAFFFYGFTLYSIGTSLISIPFFPIYLCRLTQLIGLCLMLLVFREKIKFKDLDIYAQAILLLFIFWQFIICIRDDEFSLWNFQKYFFTQGYFLYLFPVFLLCINNIRYFGNIIDIVVLFCKLYVFFILFLFPLFIYKGTEEVSINLFETLNSIFASSTIFGILYINFIPYKQRKWLFIASAISIILALILARRSIVVIYAMTIIAYIAYKYKYKIVSFKSKLLYIISIVFSVSTIYLFLNLYGSFVFDKFSERMLDDTRSVVDISFIDDLFLENNDYIIGRGISGKYYSPSVESNGDNYREHIESGYYELILKGGIVFVIIYILLLFPAIFLGLFKSKNDFCRLAGLYILLFSGFLYGVGSFFSLGIRYMIVLFCLFCCYTKKYRMMSNNDFLYKG